MYSDFGKIDVRKPDFIPLHGSFSVVYWGRTPELVNDHDFRSLADGIMIPGGVYGLHANTGAFYAGTCYDIPILRLTALQTGGKRWQQLYPVARKLCILSDSGASNGYTSNTVLQTRFRSS